MIVRGTVPGPGEGGGGCQYLPRYGAGTVGLSLDQVRFESGSAGSSLEQPNRGNERPGSCYSPDYMKVCEKYWMGGVLRYSILLFVTGTEGVGN